MLEAEEWEEDQRAARRILERIFDNGRLEEILGDSFYTFLGGPASTDNQVDDWETTKEEISSLPLVGSTLLRFFN